MNFKNRHEMGSGGHCLCPKCGYTVAHQRGTPCQDIRCPQCSAKLVREGSYHHQLIKDKQQKRSQNGE